MYAFDIENSIIFIIDFFDSYMFDFYCWVVFVASTVKQFPVFFAGFEFHQSQYRKFYFIVPIFVFFYSYIVIVVYYAECVFIVFLDFICWMLCF